MDLYILDDLFRRIDIVDRFESLIWTERFALQGDFQFSIHSTPANRALFPEGTLLGLNESKRVMIVETIEDKSTDQEMLKISGRSLEAILEDRIARDTLSSLEFVPRWPIVGTPGEIIRKVFRSICIVGALDKRDIIPFIKEGSIFTPDTILEPKDSVYLELEPDTLYATIRDLCAAYGLGFALVRNEDKSELYFTVYAGSDRTSVQRNFAPVIFSPELDTLANVSELVSMASYKNVAYVYSPSGVAVVYAPGADPSAAGFKRRVLLVKVDTVTPTDDEEGLTIEEILQKRGYDALLEHRRVSAFDGEIPKSGYKYGIDYNLGDVVEMRTRSGDTNYMRVTEQIFVSDAEGDRSYPTLAIDQFITRGSWFAWSNDEVWDEAQGTWDDAGE